MKDANTLQAEAVAKFVRDNKRKNFREIIEGHLSVFAHLFKSPQTRPDTLTIEIPLAEVMGLIEVAEPTQGGFGKTATMLPQTQFPFATVYGINAAGKKVPVNLNLFLGLAIDNKDADAEKAAEWAKNNKKSGNKASEEDAADDLVF